MTGDTGTRKKGLLAGFLTGSALCLSLGAAATYVSPLGLSSVETSQPETPATEVTSTTPSDEGAQLAIITPRSDTTRVAQQTPAAEAPEADRDSVDVSPSVRATNERVQTDTPEIAAPQTSDAMNAETATVEAPTPSIPAIKPLAPSESAPENSVEVATVEATETPINDPVTDNVEIQQLATEEAPVTLALKAPQVDRGEVGEAPELPKNDILQTNEAPSVSEPADNAIASQTKPDAPVVAELPKASPVYTPDQSASAEVEPLLPPATDSDEIDVSGAELPASTETFRSGQTATNPVLSAPQNSDTSPVSPEAPDQDETVKADQQAEPQLSAAANTDQAEEIPLVTDQTDQTASAEGATDSTLPTTKPKTDPRNPPPPEFEGRAFDAFAVRFIPPNNKPFLSIVLEHVPGDSVSMYDLLNFGKPVAFGVSTEDELSRWRENEFRKAGFEVVALAPDAASAGLSESMQDALIPTRLENYLTAVPGAVAVLDSVGSDLYRDPRKVAQVATELETSGRGFLVHERFGVNRALEAARSSGIPAASLVRVIDEQRDASSIRRALDRAALEASKTGASIVYGRTYPETIAAALTWLLGNSARSVTIAPLTLTMERLVE